MLKTAAMTTSAARDPVHRAGDAEAGPRTRAESRQKKAGERRVSLFGKRQPAAPEQHMPPPRGRRLGQAARGDRERLPQIGFEIRIARAVGLGLAVGRDRPAVFPRPEVRIAQVVVDGSVAKSVGEQRFQKGRRLAVVRRRLRGIEDLKRAEERSLRVIPVRRRGPSPGNRLESVRSTPERSCSSLRHPVPGGVPGSGSALGRCDHRREPRVRCPSRIPPIRSLPAIAGLPPDRRRAPLSGRGSRRLPRPSDPRPTMFRMSAINPTRADRMARRASLDCPAASGLAGLGQLAFGGTGERAVCAARPRRPTCGDVPRRRRSGSPRRTTDPPPARPACSDVRRARSFSSEGSVTF